MTTASTRKKAPPHGIGPVTREWVKGARKYLRVLKQLQEDVAMRETTFVEREYRGARRFRSVFLSALMDVQKCNLEVQAGFAAMMGDLVAVQIDGGSHDAEHVRKLLKTAVISQ
jgi:hypothetical protein